MTKESTWDEAKKLAISLEKKPDIVRKAIYNRRRFVNEKIKSALVKREIIDPRSPAIHEIAVAAETIAINVVHFLETHHAKILAEIKAAAAGAGAQLRTA